MYLINPNIFILNPFHHCVTVCPLRLSVVKKKCKEKFYHCEKHLPPAIVSPSALTTPPASRHKKDEKLLSAFCELSAKYLSWEQGVIMLSERSKKKKKSKKEKRGGGKSWQKPHIAQVPPPWSRLCTDLLVLVVGEVVQP